MGRYMWDCSHGVFIGLLQTHPFLEHVFPSASATVCTTSPAAAAGEAALSATSY